MNLPRRIFLVRHGQKLITGKLSNQNYPLTKIGERQAEITGQYLRELLKEDPPTDRFRSTLLRAQQTDEIIFNQLSGLAPSLEGLTDSRLDEKSNGIFDELTSEEIEVYSPEQLILKKRLGYYHNRPQGGESCPDAELRVLSFVKDQLFYRAGVVIITGHGTWFKLFHKLLRRLSVEEFLKIRSEVEIPHCGIIEYSQGDSSKNFPKIIVQWKGLIEES